jgi:3-methyladenine DNA glycosylase AlkC
MKEKFSLKDQLFNEVSVRKLSDEIYQVSPVFEKEAFYTEVVSAFPELALKERIYHIRDMLSKYLPDAYEEALSVILQALPGALDPLKEDDDFGNFIYAPYGEFVVYHGCNLKYLNISLQALREITRRFSVEFAIRDFINHYPEETMAMLKVCASSENYHERRLASEGSRPKLPWAKKLTIDYKNMVSILDKLYFDKTRYVTRSVANHLNDISKIDPILVIATLQRWKITGKQNEKEMDYIISHALRTLVKEGNEEALALLGYKKDPKIVLSDLNLHHDEVWLGEALIFDFEIEAKEDCKLLIDYIIYFRTKSGKASPKVHKIKKLSLKAGECIGVSKKHLFRANMSTRKLYVGEHKVELQINGKRYSLGVFNLNI